MPRTFTSMSRATEDDPFAKDFVELETKRSLKLHDLFMYFVQDAEQAFFEYQKLSSFGVDATALPDITSLSSGRRYFRPLESVGPVAASYPQIYSSPGLFEYRSELSIIRALEKVQYGGRTGLSPLEPVLENGFWNEIYPMCTHPFFGIDAGWEFSPNLDFVMSSLYEWILPTSCANDQTPHVPHLKIVMSTSHDVENLNNMISQGELSVLMSASYNRVYQPGYEKYSIFPIRLISAYPEGRVRIMEAVFDQVFEKFRVKFTPILDFAERNESLWDLFLRYVEIQALPAKERRHQVHDLVIRGSKARCMKSILYTSV